MKEKIDKITELTDIWYNMIGSDHHKDRDCHWYIETKWSYGQPPKYTVQHFGYIIDSIEEVFSTYDKALDGLILQLNKSIEYIKEDNNYYDGVR